MITQSSDPRDSSPRLKAGASSPGPVRVVVSQEDIDSGYPGSPFECPVALAVARATAGRHVAVKPDRAEWQNADGNWCGGFLPPGIVETVRLFDQGKLTGPFTFDWNVGPV